ncbi:hypothetical protein FHX37_3329 [Haloactinospora alba]|uniref:DUF4352 domain-containing protein n=1 Tax=Haloactinospora alba TaxID=405555 RepID=A0A543NNB2_9ACTN|nr:DUF4352 domain-containing protein [Haloactinospora alba]TQN33315.1 hypothetical protein FHX37_3329 [Haloactinospora alba]
MGTWTWSGMVAGALVVGLVVGWFGPGAYTVRQLDEGAGKGSVRGRSGGDGEKGGGESGFETLEVGDSADVRDAYIRDSYSHRYELTVDDVRYYEEVTGTAHDYGKGPVFVTEPAEHLFAAVDLTITNTGSEPLELLPLGRYADADGELVDGERVRESVPGDIDSVLPEDVGSEAPGEHVMSEADEIPPEATTQVVGLAVVAEPDGYLYSPDNSTWRIHLPDRE